jgi:hypothetical protein
MTMAVQDALTEDDKAGRYSLACQAHIQSDVGLSRREHARGGVTRPSSMNIHMLFGVSVLLSFAAFGVVTMLYIVPRLRRVEPDDALVALVVPHTFRFIGLSFLVPGVVAPSLPAAFAAPAAYGDAVAAILAMATTLALRRRVPGAVGLVWLFNVWGSADLVYAFYQGQLGVGLDASALGAAFYIPTALVRRLLRPMPLAVRHAALTSDPRPDRSRRSCIG